MTVKLPKLGFIAAALACCAFSSASAGYRCAMDVGGLGHYYVCKGHVWCNVDASSCHEPSDVAGQTQVAKSDSNQCTHDQYVTEDGTTINQSSLTAPIMFNAKDSSTECFTKSDFPGFWTAVAY